MSGDGDGDDGSGGDSPMSGGAVEVVAGRRRRFIAAEAVTAR